VKVHPFIVNSPFQMDDKFQASMYDGRFTAICLRLEGNGKGFQARAADLYALAGDA
jgi:hypothetical protein